ncbi:MAG: hypothetical protein K1X35_02155 [Caulobacteraceae bacterium]|nr:hypothetical protein [Caulobacteraceae bacterium]
MGYLFTGGSTGRSSARALAGLAALGLAAAAAVAEAAPTWEKQFILSLTPSKEFGRGIRWIERPPDSAVFALFPEQAFRDHVSGATTLECTSTLEGRLVDCSILEEKPEGHGFADASKGVMALYRFGPLDRLTPEMAGRRIKIAVIWQVHRNTSREVRP